MKKLVVLGAKGNLGSQITKVFEGDSYQVLAWDRYDVDITDKELVTKKINEIKPDIIINAVAYNAMDLCEQDERAQELAEKINGEAVGYIADAAVKNKSILVHLSTDYVFDGDNEEGYSEEEKTNPISKYGKSKEAGEKEVVKRSGKGLKWYLIRSSKLFGPKGESEGSKESFFDLVLRLSQEKKEFNMVHGEEVSCFTYTLDLARAIKQMIEDKKPFGIYHIFNTGPASWYDGAKFLFALKGIGDVKLIPSKSADYPRPAKRPKYSVLLNTKLEPLRSWKEALEEYLGK